MIKAILATAFLFLAPAIASAQCVTYACQAQKIVRDGGGVSSASPAFTGVPTAPTAAIGDVSTQLATDAFVAAATANPHNVLQYGVSTANSEAANTSAINALVTALCNAGGGAIYLPAGDYAVTAGSINVTCSDVGFIGDGSEVTTLVSSEGSGNLISFTGSSGSILQHNFVKGLSIGRSVNPAIGSASKGLNLSYTNWTYVTDVFSYNSVYEFWASNVTAGTFFKTHAFRTGAYQGTGDIYVGYRLTGNNGNYSTKFIDTISVAVASNGTLWGGTGYGYWFDGADMRDLTLQEAEGDNTTYGAYLDFSGTSGTDNWNDRIINSTFDTCGTACIYVTTLQNTGMVQINGGWMNPANTSAINYGLYVTASQGVLANGQSCYGGSNPTYTRCYYATNSSNVQITNNQCKSAAYCVYFDNATAVVNMSVIANNLFFTDSTGHQMTAAVYLNGSTNISLDENKINANAANSITSGFVGANSPASVVAHGNHFNTAAISGSKVTGFASAGNSFTDNPGYNPIGTFTPGTTISSGVLWTNTTGAPVMITIGGGTVSAIAVNATATGLTSGAFYLSPGSSITVTWSATPTVTYEGA